MVQSSDRRLVVEKTFLEKLAAAAKSTSDSISVALAAAKTYTSEAVALRVPFRQSSGVDLNILTVTEDVLFSGVKGLENAPDNLPGMVSVRNAAGQVLQTWTTITRNSSQPQWSRYRNSGGTWSGWSLVSYRGPNPASFDDDFNTMRTPGVYAITGINHPNQPVPLAGGLEVKPSNAQVAQTFTTWEAVPAEYTRRATSATGWSAWVQKPTQATVATANTETLRAAKQHSAESLEAAETALRGEMAELTGSIGGGFATAAELETATTATLSAAKKYAATLSMGTTLEATDAALSQFVGELTTETGAELAKRFARLDDPAHTVTVTAAAGDGITDDSAHFTAAINAAAAGGVVSAKRGQTYVVQNLPLRENVWLDLRGITLKLPPTGAAPMFTAPASAKFVAGGIHGGEFVGVNKTRHFIDFGAVSTLEHFVMDSLFVHDFDRAYSGSKNDRFVVLTNSRWHYNNIAAYVNMNHPIMHFNDFRYNDIGLTGSLNDVFAIGNKFNANRIGVTPDLSVPGSKIQNCQFISGAVGKNSENGMVLDHSNTVTGVLFYGNDSADDGLTLRGDGNMIQANLFGYMAQIGCWGGACIRLDGDADSRYRHDGNIISGNRFILGSPTGHGIVSDSAAQIRGTLITGNSVKLHHAAQFVKMPNAAIALSRISNNTLTIRSDTTHTAAPADALIHLGNVAGGMDVKDNTFISDRTENPAAALWMNTLAGSLLDGNRFHGYTAPVASNNWAGAHLGMNPGINR